MNSAAGRALGFDPKRAMYAESIMSIMSHYVHYVH